MNYHENNTFLFTGQYCREITWAIIIDGRYYFDQRLMPEDFHDRNISQVDFPSSLLNLTAQAVHQFTPLTRFDFPYQWELSSHNGNTGWGCGARRG